MNNLGNTINSLPGLVRPAVPNPIDCLGDLADKLAELGTEAAETVVEIVEDPGALAEAGFEAATDVAEKAAEAATDPRAAFDLGISLARKPADAVQGIGNAAFGFASTAAGNVPVIGPGAAEALGEMQNAANFVFNGAQNAVFNNEAVGFISEGLGAVGSGVGSVVTTIGTTFSNWFNEDDPPPWYTVSQARCDYGRHHWNELFQQCFENGAVVIQDNTLRQAVMAQGGDLGPCIGVPIRDGAHLGVSRCTGQATNQIHIEPLTRRIRMATSAYNGYTGGYTGFSPFCLTTAEEPFDVAVYLRRYGTIGGGRQEWRFTSDGKLQSGTLCAMNVGGAVRMRNCAEANSWLASSIMPDRHHATGVAPFGRIQNQSSAPNPFDRNQWLCPYWLPVSGPWRLDNCTKAAGESDWVPRNSVSITPTGVNNQVRVFAPRPYDREVIFPCMGADAATKTFLVRHCHPHVTSPDSLWRVERLYVNNGWKVDGNSASLRIADMLQGTYRLRNEQTNRCLGWRALNDGSMTLNLMICADGNGNAEPRVQWTGYAPDQKGINARAASGYAQRAAEQAQAAQQAYVQARLDLFPSLLEWQRERTRAENARSAALVTQSQNQEGSELFRRSPARCNPGKAWDRGQCVDIAPDPRFPIAMLDENGNPSSVCLGAEFTPKRPGASLGACWAATANDGGRDRMTFEFDDFGRVRSTVHRYGRPGEKTVVGYKCMQPSNPPRDWEGSQIVEFETCSAPVADGDGNPQVNPAEVWRLASDGTFVSSDNRCVRKTFGRTAFGNAEVLTLQDCATEPWETNSDYVRFAPRPETKLYPLLGLPETARLRVGGGQRCVRTDLVRDSVVTLAECSGHPGEYFAFGARSANAFEIAPRNSLTCLTASDQLLRQSYCVNPASTTQQFIRLEDGRIANVATGLCLTELQDGRIGLLDCGDGALSGIEVEDVTGNTPGFAPPLQLQQPVVPGLEMQRTRASLFYFGTYIDAGGLTLHKTDADGAVFSVPGSVNLNESPRDVPGQLRPANTNMPGGQVPFTDLLLLPGFADGHNHITIAHAAPVRYPGGAVRTNTSDPYAGDFPDWLKDIHWQRVMRLRADGSLGFDLIEESEDFRRGATFRMILPDGAG
ncbi:MAG: hypothetical protein AAFO79_04705, partial [Pseudomonadota bacterium]